MVNWELKTSFILGVLHSLEPGHGKTAMVAMMLDPRKKWWDSLALAFSVVFSHSFLILAIAVVTHFSGHLLLGNNMDQFLIENLKTIGALSLIFIGLFLLLRPEKKTSHCCSGSSNHAVSSPKIPVLLGISIGLYPCPSLIATFLASLTTGKMNYGITAVCLFSLGSFASILLTGLSLKWLGGKLSQNFENRFARVNWRALQGFVILSVGGLSLITH